MGEFGEGYAGWVQNNKDTRITTAQKMFFIKFQETGDLITFIEEILNGKTSFFCVVDVYWHYVGVFIVNFEYIIQALIYWLVACTQPTFVCLKSTIEILAKGLKYIQN